MNLREESKTSNSADSGSRKNFKPKYAKTVDLSSPTDVVVKDTYELLLKNDFDGIEKLANNARSNKERLVGGYWKLDSIYEGLADIYSENHEQTLTDEIWKNRIELLKSWKQKLPDSITARVALAMAYINYGWFARGWGYANAVSDEDIKFLNERLSLARKELTEAKNLDIRCPRWYREVLFLGMATGISKTEFNEVYEEAVKFEPNYIQFYLVKSEFLTPKWSGNPGDWEEYINSLPDELSKLGTDESDMIFFIVVAGKLRDPSVSLNSVMKSRDHIYKGFDDLENKYKLDKKRLNQCAYVSVVTSNIPGAKWAFDRIENDWDKDVWGSKEKFDVMKQATMQR